MKPLDSARTYWQHRTEPGWDQATSSHYRMLARELLLVLDEFRPRSVLEIGCGSGDLFPFFGFEADSYTGVDLSPAMLDRFRARYPGLDLRCGDGAAFREDRHYDLVLSNGVVQNFSLDMLDTHLRNARAMVGDGGCVVLGSVPWRRHYSRFTAASAWSEARRGRLLQSLGVLLRGPGFGRWYRCNEVARVAAHHGLAARFFGSATYMYRFHAVLHVT
jgi:SAM-dependent methyltransferase